jgi:hypothetical protein
MFSHLHSKCDSLKHTTAYAPSVLRKGRDGASVEWTGVLGRSVRVLSSLICSDVSHSVLQVPLSSHVVNC